MYLTFLPGCIFALLANLWNVCFSDLSVNGVRKLDAENSDSILKYFVIALKISNVTRVTYFILFFDVSLGTLTKTGLLGSILLS